MREGTKSCRVLMETLRRKKGGEGKHRNQYKNRDRALYMRQNHERGPRRESFDWRTSGSFAASPDWGRPRDVGRSGGTKGVSVAPRGAVVKQHGVGSANARTRLVSISLIIVFHNPSTESVAPCRLLRTLPRISLPLPRPGGWPEIAKTGPHTNNTNNTYVF